jgi:cell division protein FtsI (penicillin-binding protein 3)
VVAGPIFKEISDKVYSTQHEMHAELAMDTTKSSVPSAAISQWKDLNSIYGHLNIKTHTRDPDAEWVYAIPEADSVTLKEREFSQGFVPKVIGMAAADAIYLLENAGLKVELVGSGRIYKQSITPGTRITNGRTIVIELA